MLTDKDLYTLNELYINIIEVVKLHGSDKHTKLIPLLESQVSIINSNKSIEEKTNYLLTSCKTIFSAKDGLSDFDAKDTNSELKSRINGIINKDMQNIWNILKRV